VGLGVVPLAGVEYLHRHIAIRHPVVRKEGVAERTLPKRALDFVSFPDDRPG
jgi:hypothetical protein